MLRLTASVSPAPQDTPGLVPTQHGGIFCENSGMTMSAMTISGIMTSLSLALQNTPGLVMTVTGMMMSVPVALQDTLVLVPRLHGGVFCETSMSVRDDKIFKILPPAAQHIATRLFLVQFHHPESWPLIGTEGSRDLDLGL